MDFRIFVLVAHRSHCSGNFHLPGIHDALRRRSLLLDGAKRPCWRSFWKCLAAVYGDHAWRNPGDAWAWRILARFTYFRQAASPPTVSRSNGPLLVPAPASLLVRGGSRARYPNWVGDSYTDWGSLRSMASVNCLCSARNFRAIGALGLCKFSKVA